MNYRAPITPSIMTYFKVRTRIVTWTYGRNRRDGTSAIVKLPDGRQMEIIKDNYILTDDMEEDVEWYAIPLLRMQDEELNSI